MDFSRKKRKEKLLLCSHRHTTVIAGPTCLIAHLLASHDRGFSLGCATFIREFESRREEEDKQEKARALERRQQAKEAAAAEAADRREQAAATALSGTGNDGASDGIAPETVSGNVLKEHKSKRGTVWQVFDLSVEHPTCTVLKPNGERCGVQPAKSAGTSNYWNHLWST